MRQGMGSAGLRRSGVRKDREPTIALINIVFLMLVFFLVAGTLARPLERELRLVQAADLEGVAPADALVILADGGMRWRGEVVEDVADFVAAQPDAERARVVPDRDLPAADLVRIGRALRGAGAGQVVIVTERGL
ncbi:ExbD/TolR family protein [Aquicoccus sp.]|uniref:ExbD/TolR family protein n=1 Tax=Aquicoccus sp. TaxID=2055851 RepID=UPI0035655BAC